MDILVMSWRDPKHPQAGGAEQVMHEHMKGWIEAGHEVTLFSSKIHGQPKREELDGIKIVRSGHQYLGVQISGFIYWIKNCKKYSLVVDQFHGIPFFTPLYVSKPKLAVLQEVAREVWFTNPMPWPFNWIIGVIGYLSEFFIFQLYRATPFMVGSSSAKKDLERMGIPAKKIIIIPHGVIIRRPKLMPKKETQPTVIFLGALTKDKGVEDAIKCFAILARDSNYCFWIVGRAEDRLYLLRLRRIVGKLNLKNRVKFWGFVGQERKFELLARAHVMVNPSMREGWGLVNIEANAMGTPVVGYHSSGLVDSIRNGETGVVIKKNLPEELAVAVSTLLDNTERLDELRRGAISWSRGFSWIKSKEISINYLKKVQNGQV